MLRHVALIVLCCPMLCYVALCCRRCAMCCYIVQCCAFPSTLLTRNPRIKLLAKRVRDSGYPVRFLLASFRKVKYSNRTKWLSWKNKSHSGRFAAFKSTFNCSNTLASRLHQAGYRETLTRSRLFC